jgi:hypothetical protein
VLHMLLQEQPRKSTAMKLEVRKNQKIQVIYEINPFLTYYMMILYWSSKDWQHGQQDRKTGLGKNSDSAQHPREQKDRCICSILSISDSITYKKIKINLRSHHLSKRNLRFHHSVMPFIWHVAMANKISM